MAALTSYVHGAWITPSDDGSPVHDAVSGERIASLSTSGIDMARAVGYARGVGGPRLRGLTFHQRGAILKALAAHLGSHRDELYELSLRTGATRSDSMIDIDGGIGVLYSYASKARRELPADTILLDGDTEALGRGGTFAGQHIYTSRLGVAVQINAFNFPVWGPLEKFAPAFLAGMPSLIKPASPTAYLTHRLVELIVESGIVPDGALALIAGGVGDLLNQLGEQDSIGFTGSASTAQRLRQDPAVVARGTRFTAEADSLNCSILGPDAQPGTPEFDLFVKALVAEMTVKAGQKCTAIRRALVPISLLDAVEEAATKRLAAITIGNPADPEVRMGSLVGLPQRDEVRRSLKALMDAGRVAFGDPERVDVVGADAERGAFMSPVLIRADGDRAEPHTVEAFGPVSTLMGYESVAHAVDLAARGAGSLVGSLVTHDTDVAATITRGIAAWHGRLLILDRDDAKESTGHGSPLPALVHGGPGRAGGGEELGGIRAVAHHMQRTAVQASPRMLTSITGRWTNGAERTDDGVHPFRKSLRELRVGDSIVAGPRTVTADDIARFAEHTGDTFYAHTDPVAAAANPFFDGIVAHGYLIVALAAGLFVDPNPGPVLANYGIDNLRFLTPAYPGDELTVTLTCKAITPRGESQHGEVRWDAEVVKQGNDVVARYDVLTMVANEWQDN
jgi:oxepin-CoA hydrolase / 3-oxo-5,6-dehydrosuberyl-CoA semialdehyde dehydrogenase